MINKLKYLISVSLKRKIVNKWFLITNLLLLVFTVGLINIDNLVQYFGGDFNENQTVYVIDNTSTFYGTLVQENENYSSIIQVNDGSVFNLILTDNNAEDIIKEDSEAWVLVIDEDEENIVKASLISEGYINSTSYTNLSSIINSAKKDIALSLSDISKEELNKINSSVSIERKVLDETKNSDEENAQMILGTVFPIFILPFFLLTIFLVQMIGAEINDEKSTRGMEIIISNVSPKVHLLSKIISSNLFVIIQGILMLIFGLIGMLVRMKFGSGVSIEIGSLDTSVINTFLSSVSSSLIYVIPLTIIIMLLTFVLYSLLSGILASMTTNIDDFQQLQTPIMIISMLGYYLAVMSSLFEGSLFIKIFAYIPFVSAILAPCLFVLGEFTVIDFVIAIILVIVVIWLLVKFGFKVYKEGILNYSSSNLWKKMFKALKS